MHGMLQRKHARILRKEKVTKSLKHGHNELIKLLMEQRLAVLNSPTSHCCPVTSRKISLILSRYLRRLQHEPRIGNQQVQALPWQLESLNNKINAL